MIDYVVFQGDSTVYTFEVSTDAPHLDALSDFKADGVHQALSFLPKLSVDVRRVELARAMRLTSNSIKPVTFRVPRLKVIYLTNFWPRAGSGVVRMDPLHFLAGCRTRRLNQA